MSLAKCVTLKMYSGTRWVIGLFAWAVLGGAWQFVWAQGAQQSDGTVVEASGSVLVQAAASSRVMDLDVYVNKRALGTWPVLERGGYLYVAVPNLEIWRLKQRSEVVLLQERGQFWYPLAAVRGSEIRLAFADRRLEMSVPESSQLSGTLAALPLPTPTPSKPAQVSTPVQKQDVTQTSVQATSVDSGRMAAASSAASEKAVPTAVGQRFVPMEVTVNGSRAGNWILLESRGVLYAPEDAFEEWRVIRSPQAVPLEVRSQRWFALSSVPGFESQINFANQSIDLRFSPKAFAATKLTQEVQQQATLTPSIPAAFVNYDLNYTTQANRGLSTSKDLGALLELGFSNKYGVLTSSYAGTGLIHSDPAASTMWRRLETTFSKDLPEDNLTFRVGDSSTRSGIGGRSVYFGGLQIGKNYGLTPGYLTQPIPTISGMSAAPSTVELYVNDALRQTSKVPTGPFAIDNFPLLTGSGQARVVVRDLLGRETVLVQDFFTHSSLLEKGLSDWSYEIGAVRQNLGTLNADYGQKFTSGLYRYGLSQSSTIEAKAQAGQDTKGMGLALSQALPGQMLGQFSVAASKDANAGRGHQISAGVEHSNLRHGFTARVEGAGINYRQVGQDSTTVPTKLQKSASYNYAHPTLGNLGLAYARIDSYNSDPLTTYSLNYSSKLGERSSLALTLTKVIGPTSGTAVGMSLMIPLDKTITSSSSVTHRDGRLEGYTAVTNGLTEETGVGYRALLGTRGSETYSEGGVYYQGDQVMLTADVNASKAQQTLRLGGRGGFAVVDGHVFVARRIENSFAVVEVPGYANVGVGFQGSSLTRTDASGVAILSRLTPYSPNSIRLDPRELPISAEIDSIEQVAVPAARSAVKVVFPVRTGRGAIIKLLLDDGQPAPAGAEVELVGDKHEFFVARRGEAFVTGLQDKNEIRLKHKDQTCAVKVNLPPSSPDEISRVGPLTCSGVTR